MEPWYQLSRPVKHALLTDVFSVYLILCMSEQHCHTPLLLVDKTERYQINKGKSLSLSQVHILWYSHIWQSTYFILDNPQEKLKGEERLIKVLSICNLRVLKLFTFTKHMYWLHAMQKNSRHLDTRSLQFRPCTRANRSQIHCQLELHQCWSLRSHHPQNCQPTCLNNQV